MTAEERTEDRDQQSTLFHRGDTYLKKRPVNPTGFLAVLALSTLSESTSRIGGKIGTTADGRLGAAKTVLVTVVVASDVVV